MKKLYLLLLAITLLSSSAFAGFGVGVKGGLAENDPKDAHKIFSNAHESVTETLGDEYFGIEAFYEMNIADSYVHKLGFKIGTDFYLENEWEYKWSKKTITENTLSLPLTVYYKYDGGIKGWSFFAGAGATILSTEVDFDGYDGLDKESKTKVFPHITAGTEYRFCKLFALGLDLRYNFGAKVEKSHFILSDRSGFGAAIAGKFYF